MGIRKRVIGVVGASVCSNEISKIAEEVGREIARRGAVLICGGLGGVMESACKGAKEAGGLTIGVLPSKERRSANPYVDLPIATGFGEGRNVIIVHSCDGIIAISGQYGTLSEIAFALNLGLPIVGISTWEIDVPIVRAKGAKEAVDLLFDKISTQRSAFRSG